MGLRLYALGKQLTAAVSYSFTEAKDLCIGDEEQARPFTVAFATRT